MECPDLQIFGLKSVQILIDAHLAHWRFYNTWMIGLPIYLQLLSFTVWSDIVLPNIKVSETFETLDNICWVVLLISCSYELILEGSAVINVGPRNYLRSTPRLIKLISPTLMMIIIFWDKENLEQDVYFWTVQCWAALALWMRYLVFLRTLNRFDWLIRLIIECWYDMSQFLVVFLIGVLAFSSTNVSIEEVLRIQGLKEREVNEDAWFIEKYFGGWFDAITM